jgi:hypothetical protein
MPERNCPQANVWCPHHDYTCKPVSERDEPCVHAKSLVAAEAQLALLMEAYGKSSEEVASLTDHTMFDGLTMSLLG